MPSPCDDLALFVRRAAVGGDADLADACMLWAADWVRASTGKDPAAAWRDPSSWQARLWDFEVERVARETMGACGFVETTAPRRGDVGVVVTPTGRPTAAICLGRRWAALAPEGVAASATWPVVVAWSLRCPPPSC